MFNKQYIRDIALRREEIENINEYPFNIAALRELEKIDLHPEVTFLVGENGAGKSTLIEAIATAMGFSAEGGTRNFQVSTADTVSNLNKYLKITKGYANPKDFYFLRAESFYNVATYMDTTGYLAGYGDRSLHECSHGEAFMATLTIKLKGNGLYIFDEPEAALSPTRQMAALTAIHGLVEKNSQFIIATHSPILLAYPNAKILLLDDGGINEVSYEDTEHYTVTKSFINNYSQMLTILFDEN